MDHTPVILVDSREQRPLRTSYPAATVGLAVGDYSIRGFHGWDNPGFIVERKSIDDLVGSLTGGRARFLREVEKMRQFRFRALLVEGCRASIEMKSYRSNAHPHSILASVDALAVRTNLHVFWCENATGAGRQLDSLVRQFVRGVEKDFRRLDMKTAVDPLCGANGPGPESRDREGDELRRTGNTEPVTVF